VTCFIATLLSTHPQIMLRERRESRPHHHKATFESDAINGRAPPGSGQSRNATVERR
jgi:hypothetical protein